MQTLVTGNVDMNKLHDYLIKEVPTFHRVGQSSIGIDYALDDCGRVHKNGEDVTISFADDLPMAVIQAALTVYKG
jgi:hypothetical protein|tara:strand:- start:627 stop:851 length:225 start_codon:yes stop_codon:yes gene_type:complete